MGESELSLLRLCRSEHFRPELGRRTAVCLAEDPAQMARVRDSPAGSDIRHSLFSPGGVGEVGAAALEAPLADPAGDGDSLRLEELVQVPLGDEVRLGNLGGTQFRIAQV